MDKVKYWSTCEACNCKQIIPNAEIKLGHVPPCRECGKVLTKVFRTKIGAIGEKPITEIKEVKK